MDREPSGVTPVLGASGAAPPVKLGETEWKIGHPTQRAKAALELLVIAEARTNVEALKGVLSAEEYQDERAKLSAQIRGGAWKTWGSLWGEVCSGPNWMPLWVCALLRENHPDATVAQARELWLNAGDDVLDCLYVVVPDFFTVLIAELAQTDASRVQAAIQWRAETFEPLMRRRRSPASTTTT